MIKYKPRLYRVQLTHNTYNMEKDKKNQELQSRREFFKKAAKSTLPILAFAVVGPSLLSSCGEDDDEPDAPNGCGNSCSGSCEGTCSGGCDSACEGVCENGCDKYLD